MVKASALAFLFACGFSACANTGSLLDPAIAAKVDLVLRVRLVSERGSDKLRLQSVRVVKVLKNSSRTALSDSMDIASYSWKPGIPPGESTVYLEPYVPASGLWKLYGGERTSGVSHFTENGH